MEDKITISLTTLLTGFAVVFAVLLLLIGIIKLYGTIIYQLQTGKQKKRERLIETPAAEPSATAPDDVQPVATIEADVADEDELIAVISAAVYAMYSSDKVRIKSIRKSRPAGAWRNAGLSDSVRPF